MLIDTALIVGSGYLISTAITNVIFREQNKLTNQFDRTVTALKLEGFKLKRITKIENGYEFIVSIPDGKSFDDLEKHKKVFNDNMRCICDMENIRFTKIMKLKCITKDLGKYPFKTVQTYANKLFIAREFDNVPFFIDLDKEGHVLIAGQSGTGKTFLLSSILTNLIATNSSYIEIHLSQIMKGEVGQFKNCKSVKSINYTLEEVSKQLEKMAQIVDQRSNMFSELGLKNLTHYIQKTKKAMKRIFFVIEEVSFFIPSESDPEERKTLKAKCWENILIIVKAGRSAGVHFLSVTQRSTVANLPSEVKAQMCCITTKQRSGLDSRNIIEVDDAKDLKERECLIWGRDGLKLLKLPFIDEDFKDLQKYVPEIIVFGDEAAIDTTTKGTDLIRESYIDMRVEEYNKLQEKQNNIIKLEEVAVEVEKTKKPKGRPSKKGVNLKC